MATGSVSAIDREEWQLIESKSATGTTLTFNAFSGYKHLWLVGNTITKSASDYTSVRPNNNSTSGLYVHYYGDGTADKFIIAQTTASAQAISFKIFDVDKTIPKKVSASWGSLLTSPEIDAFIDTVAVTSLRVYTNGGSATFNSGTFTLYGIVA
jgi:hypothetical protein